MSDEFKYQLSVSIPSGEQYEKGDMLNIRGDNPDQFRAALQAFDAQMAQLCADVANGVKAAYAAVRGIPGATVVQEQPAQQQDPWASSAPQQQQAAPQQQRQQQQGGGQRQGGRPHPEGLACDCGKVLEYKQTGGGKVTWRCPDWRWNNGNPNGHRQEWG